MILPPTPPKAQYWLEQFYISDTLFCRVAPRIGDSSIGTPSYFIIKDGVRTSISPDEYERTLASFNNEPIQKHLLTYVIDNKEVNIAVTLNQEHPDICTVNQ